MKTNQTKQGFSHLLESLGMTGYRLSKTTGLPISTIQMYMSADRDPKLMSLESAQKIASALGITIDDLWNGL